MSAISEFSSGMGAYSRAHTVIFKYNLSKYLIIPGIVCIAYSAIFLAVAGGTGAFVAVDAADLPSYLSWLGDAANWVARALYWIVLIFLFYITFRYVIQVILSPYLSKLSEVVEARVTGQQPPKLGWNEYFQDMIRAFKLAIRNVIRELFYCLILSFVPVVGTLACFFVSSYYMGFGFIDYTLERHRIKSKDSAVFCRKHRGLTVGIGTIANLGMLVPVIGWLIIPTYATVASTLETIKYLPPMQVGNWNTHDPVTGR
jgi:CysZ protein